MTLALQARTKRILKTLEQIKTPKTRLILSLSLEDNFSRLAAKHAYQIVKPIWPYEISRNPMLSYCPKPVYGDYCELHTTDARYKAPCISNLDGEDMSHSNGHKFMSMSKRCQVQFLWDAKSQGWFGSRYVHPLKRTFTLSAKTVGLFKHLITEN